MSKLTIGLLYFLEEEHLDKTVRWISQHGNWRIFHPTQQAEEEADVIVIPDNVPREHFSSFIDPQIGRTIICLGRAADCLISYMGGEVDYQSSNGQQNHMFPVVGNHPLFASINDNAFGYHTNGYGKQVPLITKLPEGFVEIAKLTRHSRQNWVKMGKIPTEVQSTQVFTNGMMWGIKYLPHLINNRPNGLAYREHGFLIGDKISNHIFKLINENLTYEDNGDHDLAVGVPA